MRMNACRILPEPGAAGKSVCSFRLPPTLGPAARAREMAVPPSIDNAARHHLPRSRGAGGPFVERLKRATKT
jgi:hypothetical protein